MPAPASPHKLPNQVEGTDSLGSENAVEGDRELLHCSDRRVVPCNDGMTRREPFQESEAQRRSAQSPGEPQHGRPDPEAVVTPTDAIHDQALPELARKALHPVNDHHRDMSINASRSLCQRLN